MQIDTIRPLSVRVAGAGTAVPAGTLSTVTADDSDATYINMAVADSGDYWSLRMGPHTVPADHERHLIRLRIRARANVGTITERPSFGQGGFDVFYGDGTMTAGSTMQDLDTGWLPFPFSPVDGTVSDLNLGGGEMTGPTGGATALQTAEVYYDIDSRRKPTYAPQVRDASGFDRSNSTVTDTQNPTIFIGPVDYDGLDANDWTVTVTDDLAVVVFTASGTGTPPESVFVTTPLEDGNHTATITVRSYIRFEEDFAGQQIIPFTIDAITPPPSPPLLTVTQEGEAYRLTWEYPGGQTWDDDRVITEVWRDDCTGSQRIATVPDGLNGDYLDTNVPRLDGLIAPNSDGVCVVHPGECDITYRVRYWGYVSTTVTLPTTVPVAIVIGWPGTVASIPSGWLRVTEYDSVYPRGSTSPAAPTVTGGSATHTHTTPNHTHRIPSHTHTLPNDTENSNTSTTTTESSAGASRASQPHSHLFPNTTGGSNVSASGAAAPGTAAASSLPLSREVIWIRSDGSATSWPVGALAFSAQNVSGWTADSLSSGRFLKGAAAAGNGGAQVGSATHTHTVLAHTHTGGTHDHPDIATGPSEPALSTSRALAGAGTPEWLSRHSHTANPVSAGIGTLPSVSGGVTGPASSEPLNRRLRVLRNTTGGLQTRIIGLYTGAIADLPPGLTYCDGTNGTVDMQGWYARDAGTASVNGFGGLTAHIHSVPSHRHGAVSHSHNVLVPVSGNASNRRLASGGQVSVPLENHTHPNSTTGNTSITADAGGSGETGSVFNEPPFREAHFVRLDGTIDGGVLPTPEQRTTEYATVTVPALSLADDLDRISALGGQALAVATERSHAFPRLSTVTVPIPGGLPTVSTGEPGEDLSLTMAMLGKADIDALEELLAADRIYWAPVGGTPGWFAPGGWTVDAVAPEIKVVSITMVRQPWPPVPDPVDLL